MPTLEYPAKVKVEIRGFTTRERRNSQRKKFVSGVIAGIVLTLLVAKTTGKPKLQVSSNDVEFAPVSIATPTANKPIVLQNVGGAVLHIGNIGLEGDAAAEYEAKTDCGEASLDPQQTCEIDVVLRPSAEGLRWAELAIASDAAEPITRIRLSGRGIKNKRPDIAIEPAQLMFEQQENTQATLPVVLHSVGDGTATIRSVSVQSASATDESYAAGQECVGKEVESGATCEMSVVFTPSAAVDGSAALVVEFSGSDANEPGQKVSAPIVSRVTGVTPQQVGKLVVDPGEVSFALHPDEKVQPATVRVVNEGDGPLTIARVDIARGAGNFGWTKQCDSEKVIAAHDECRFTVYPTVRQVGLWAGTLVVSSHEGAQEIQLSANVQPRAVAGISVSPDRLYAINVSGVDAQKFRSKLRDVALVQSTGSAALVITDIRFESPWFRLVDSSDACPQGLAIEAGTRCTIRVAYTGSEGKTSSRMLISDNAANTPHAVELVGIGFTAAPRGSLAIDGSGEFGTATVQGPVLYSLAHTVPQGSKIVLRNAGDGPLTLRGIRASGDSSSFGQISGCTFPVTLARGGTCEMSFRFAPVRASELVATYVVENDGSNPTESFRLHGVGVSASPPPAPPSHLGVAVAAGSTVVKKEMKRVRVQEVVPPPPPTVR